jgi:hypothetical protein
MKLSYFVGDMWFSRFLSMARTPLVQDRRALETRAEAHRRLTSIKEGG